MNKSKLIALSLLTAMFAACSSDEPKIGFEENEANSYVAKRSIEEAIEIASQYANQTTAETRATKLVVDKSTVSAIVSTTSRALSDTLMYAVNFEDNNGYMIISANKATVPVLAIIDSGNYQEDEEVKVDGFDYFMNAAENYVDSYSQVDAPGIGGTGEGPVDMIMVFYTDSMAVEKCYEQRLNVKWGEYWPENLYCPNGLAGCSPVAIAQVLSYFKPEMDMDITFSGRPYDHLKIDWDELLEHTTSTATKFISLSHSNTCKATDEAHKHLAVLVRQIGELAGSAYDPSKTLTTASSTFSVTKDILSDRTIIKVENEDFYDYLVDGGIALVEGYSAAEGHHAWVLDGTASINYKILNYTNWNPRTHEYSSVEVSYRRHNYVHCNWGFSGSKNGYFSEGVFNTENGHQFDLSILSVPSRTEYTGVYGYVYK